MPLAHVELSELKLNLAAVIYHPGDDADQLLATFAGQLQKEGRRLGGIVQRNWYEHPGRRKVMELRDLMTGQAIPICQELGKGAQACQLDDRGFAEAAQAIRRAIAQGVDLVVINKFANMEAQGRGLRTEIAEAAMAGIPVLVGVPVRVYPAWCAFTGGVGTTLSYGAASLRHWWNGFDRRQMDQPAAVQPIS